MTAPAKAPNKKQAQRAATYARLLEIGMRQLHEKGYGATRIVDICAEAGLTHGAFYVHFADKEDFFLQVLAHRQAIRGDWTHLARAHDPSAPLVAVVVDTLGELSGRLGGMPNWTPVMAGFYHHTRDRPEMADRLRRIYEGWIDEITEFVALLQADGRVDAAHDPRRLAVQLYAMVEGLGTHGVLYGADIAQGLVDGCLAVLTAPPP